jgi:hypothetical protein
MIATAATTYRDGRAGAMAIQCRTPAALGRYQAANHGAIDAATWWKIACT